MQNLGYLRKAQPFTMTNKQKVTINSKTQIDIDARHLNLIFWVQEQNLVITMMDYSFQLGISLEH